MSSDVEGRAARGRLAGEVAPDSGVPGEVPASVAAAAVLTADADPAVTTPAGGPATVSGATPSTPTVEPEPAQDVPAPSATRRVRARMTRRMSGQRAGAPPNRTVLEPLFAVHRGLHPKADLKLVQRAYEVAEKAHTGQFRKSGDPVHHPPVGGRDHPGRPGHGHHHAGRRAAARHGGGHPVHPARTPPPTSATRWRTWSTASPSWTRCSSVTPPRPRPSAR